MWVLWAATIAQVFPLAGVFRFGRRLTPVRWWTLAWSIVFLAGDFVQIVVARQGSNLWTNYLVTPLEDIILLYLLSLWQRNAVMRMAFRVAIPLFLIVWIALVLTVEDTANFSLFAKPFQALLMAIASLYTLISRTLESEGDRVTAHDWFWISLGTTLYYAPVTALHPFAHALISTRPDLVRLAYFLKAGIDIVAFALIARGMLCPLTPERSGGSSAPARWRSSSFSSPSAPPS